MTVSSEVNRKDYAGNGSTTNFATVFRFLENSDVKVILTVDATAVETTQVLNTDYTLTGAGLDAGGTVVMTVAPPTGTTLTVKRDVPLTQGTDYIENDDFPAESHEDALDKLTMITQQIQEELDRSLKLSESQQSSGLTLPVPVTDRFLQWDVNGDLQNVDILLQGALAVSDFAKTYLDDLTAAATRTTLDAMGRVSSGVTDNLVTIDSSDDAKDSGVAIESIPLDAVGGGTVDAITATFSPAFTALNDIKLVRVRASGANATTTPTLAVNGLTAKTIVRHGNKALREGDIIGAGHEMLLARNTSNDNYELLNPGLPDIGYGQIVQTVKTDTASTTSTSFVDLPGMTVTITPTSTTSKVLVIVHANIGGSADGLTSGLRLLRGVTELGNGDAAGSRLQVNVASGGSTADINTNGLSFLDSPNTTSAVTYKLTWRTESGTAFLNRAGSDTDDATSYRTSSDITVTEIFV